MVDVPFLLDTHSSNIDRALTKMQPQFDSVAALMLEKEGGESIEVNNVVRVAVKKEEWKMWCAKHVENVMEGHPVTEKSNEFKRRLLIELTAFSISAVQIKELIELDYTCGASQFIFGYTAACVLNRKKGEVHGIISGFGKRWKELPDRALAEPFWHEQIHDIRRFLQYGALKQVKDTLTLCITPDLASAKEAAEQRAQDAEAKIREMEAKLKALGLQ